jgi:hypothetical protein
MPSFMNIGAMETVDGRRMSLALVPASPTAFRVNCSRDADDPAFALTMGPLEFEHLLTIMECAGRAA